MKKQYIKVSVEDAKNLLELIQSSRFCTFTSERTLAYTTLTKKVEYKLKEMEKQNERQKNT